MPASPLTLLSTNIVGCVRIKNTIHYDMRGSFQEVFNYRDFKDQGIRYIWCQDNVSVSGANVLRGLHIQNKVPQAKLVRCLFGAIYDVVVDLREDSQTFGKWDMFVLSDKNHEAVFVPEGCAHGFMTMEEDCVVHYKLSSPYHKTLDAGVKWDDPDLGIHWPTTDFPLTISEKDQRLPSLRDYLKQRG